MLNKFVLHIAFCLFCCGAFSEGCFALLSSNILYKENLAPGDKFKEKITLQNNEDHPVEVSLKQIDYLSFSNGENQFLFPGTVPRSNAKWITLSSNLIKIAPHSTQDVYYNINVPSDLPFKGAYSSLILAENNDAGSVLFGEADKPQIIVKVQYAYLVVTSVGKGEGHYEISSKELVNMESGPAYVMDLENRGEVFSFPQARINIFNKQGELVLDKTTPSQKLLPGCSIKFVVDVKELASGLYKGIAYLSDEKNFIAADKLSIFIP